MRNRKHGGQIIGNAPTLRRVLDTALQAAPSTATVLLMGESGTGKELFAHAIHQQSPRAEKPLVTVNCSALPESVIEAELFGAEKGAFTGAHVQRDGRFTRANGGTIFLDEIGELSPQIQVKILRVLQSGDYERVGGQQTLFTDCRVIAATNRDLPAAVQRGDFREDLFYRLNGDLNHRPLLLRARRDDIPLLADYFVRHYAGQNGKPYRRHCSISITKDGGLFLAWECTRVAKHHRARRCTRKETSSGRSRPTRSDLQSSQGC